jgi:multicomponent K+:H+ antiporter subunit D
MPHLMIAPIALPLLAAALMLLAGTRRELQAWLGTIAGAAGLAVAVALLRWTDGAQGAGAIGIYLPSNWHVPFGIVLAVDRLSAMMLVITSILGLAALVFARVRWERAGVHFHTLLQIQLMGLNGAFLTADLFNLFVYFEVTLAASYGLLLHGSGIRRVRSGLHYIAMNLVASFFFLMGVAMLYGVTGTLNMADMAGKLALIPADDRGLLHAGAALLAVAFLIKAAAWPLNFWLVAAYATASAPVAALFAVLTKVGVYAVLRLGTLMRFAEGGGRQSFAGEALIAVGLTTVALGALGMLTSQHPRRLAAYGITVSAGTLLAAIGFADAQVVGGALFYLMASTLAAGALFLLADLVERSRESNSPQRAFPDDEAHTTPSYVVPDVPPTRELAEDAAPVGRAIPGAMAFLGLAFGASALLVAGLPPLSGFLAKFAIMDAVLAPARAGPGGPSLAAWAMVAALIGSGLLATLAFSRAGIRYFWAPQGRPVPRLRVTETVPIGALLVLCVVLSIFPEPALRFTRAAAESLLEPTGYIDAVMSAVPVPGPARLSR